MIRIVYLIVYILLTITITTQAQNAKSRHVFGVVIDSSVYPVKDAVAYLSTMQDSIVKTLVTNVNGQFEFNEILPGKYNLTITHISYSDYSNVLDLTVDNWNDTIRLETRAMVLDVVTATSNRIKYNNDGYRVSLQNNPISKGKNTAEVLTHLPFVTNTDGGIKILGKDVGKIRINGMDVGDIKELEAIQAENLDNVEVVFSSKNDEFSLGKGGEINIKLKSSKSGGYFGSVAGHSSVYLKYGHSNSGINSVFYYGLKKLSIYNYIDFSKEHKYSDNENIVIYKDQNNSQRESFSKYRSSSRLFTERLSVNMDINERHSLGANFRYVGDVSTPKYSSHFNLFDNNTSSESITKTNSVFSNNQYQVSLNYKWKLDEKGSFFNLKSDYLRYETDEQKNYEYINNLNKEDLYSDYMYNDLNNRVNMYFVNAAFNIKINSKNEVYWGLNYNSNHTNQTALYQYMDGDLWVYNDEMNDKYKLYGDNYAGFVSFSGNISPKIDYKLSTRFEHRQMRYNSIQIGKENRKTFNIPEVSVDLSYYINKNRGDILMLSYERRSWPIPYSAISPVVNFINEYSYSKGNLDLLPAVADVLSLTMGVASKTEITFRAQRASKELQWQTFTDTKDPLVTYTMPVNGTPSYNLRLDVGHTFNITSWWKLYANGLLEWRKYDSQYSKKNNSFVSYIIIDNNLTFKNDFGGSVYLFLKSKTQYCERIYSPAAEINFSIYKYLVNRKLQLKLECTAYELERRITTETGQLLSKQYPHTNRAMVTFRLIYNFKNGKKIGGSKIEGSQTYNEIKDEIKY